MTTALNPYAAEQARQLRDAKAHDMRGAQAERIVAACQPTNGG
jgi:hypothetical protein